MARAVSPLRVAAAPALAVTVVLLLVSTRYGLHWDELYFRMLPLRWWYEDQPPLTVWLSWLAARISDDIWVQRLPAIAAAAAGAVVAGMFPRALGAGAEIQRLAAWAHAFTVYPLIMGHIFTTSAIDLLAWQVIVLLVLRATQGHHRALVWAGLVAGLACWNKLLVVALVGAIFVALLLTDRWLLRTWEAWAGAALLLTLGAPQLLAQLLNGLPMTEVSSGLVERQGTTVRLLLLPTVALFAGPPLIRVCLTGLIGPWRAAGRPGRFLLPVALLIVGFTWVSPSQPHYPMGAMLPALAMGWASPHLLAAWGRRKRWGIVAANSAIACLLCLPLLPASDPWLSAVSRVNPTIREQLGWEDYARQISEERTEGESVVVDTYALAGALHHHGTPADAAAVYSGHNALWRLGPPSTERVLLVGRDAMNKADLFEQCAPAGEVVTRAVTHPQLESVPMLRCTGPLGGWDSVWPEFRRLSG